MKNKTLKRFTAILTAVALAAAPASTICMPTLVKAESAAAKKAAKKAAAKTVNGIKGYTKDSVPSAPTLNAVLYGSDVNGKPVVFDCRHFFNLSDNSEVSSSYDTHSSRAVPIKPGHTYTASIIIHNCGKKDAKGVRLSCVLPKNIKAGKTIKLTAKFTGTNLSQSPVSNTLKLKADQNVKLTAVKNSAMILADSDSEDEPSIPVNLKQLTSKSGTLINLGSKAGVVWASGWQGAGSFWLTFSFKASKAK